jgi:hypothetical protein
MEGKLHYTPYHIGPIFIETKEHLNDFLFLHDCERYLLLQTLRALTMAIDGIITTCSQAWKREGPVKSASKGHEKHFWLEKRQRPYIELSIPTQHPKFSEDGAFRFVKALYNNTKNDSLVPLIIWNTYQHLESTKPRTKARFLKWKTNIHEIQDGDLCHVTQSRRAATLEDLGGADWEVETHLGIGADDPGLIDAFCDGPEYGRSERFPASTSADPVGVDITTQS